MKWFAIFLAVWGLVGCATDSGEPKLDAARAKSLAKVRTELAASYFERKQYDVAMEELGKAVHADPGYAPAYNMRGLVHMVLREDAEAESDFKRSLSLDSENSDAHNNYGWFLCQHGHERDAVKHFLIATQDPMYTTPGKAYMNAGVCSKKAGETQNAEMYLERALALQPGSPDVLIELAEVAFINGDYPSAKSYFGRVEQTANVQLSAENLLLGVRIEHKLGNRNMESGYAMKLKKNFPDSRETKMLGQIR